MEAEVSGDNRDERGLVTAAQAGDLHAFEELVHGNVPRVYRIALRMLGNPEEAEDATQETFLSAWRALETFRGDSAFTTWLYRIVVNHCLRLLHRRPPIGPLPDDIPAPQPGPHQLVERDERLAALRAAVARLSPEQRAAFVLRHLEGCSYDEIARALDISLNAVKSRLHRARHQILDDLEYLK